MTVSIRPVIVSGTGSFLPNDPIPNELLDEILGPLEKAPAQVQKFVDRIIPRMLKNGGVESRHFAIDPKTGCLTHTTASLGAEAGRQALESAGRKPADVDLLLLASPYYDHYTPPTSTILQEQLGIEKCAEIEIHSNCAGVGKAIQIAYDSLRLGRFKTALVVYSQLSSIFLRSCWFKQSQMNKTQATLRYILSDGSGAVVLEGVDSKWNRSVPHEVLGTFVESVGINRKPGMTAGYGPSDMREPDSQIPGLFEKGVHHLDQDFSAVLHDAGPLLLQGILRMLELLDINPADVDHYIVPSPTRQLYDRNRELFLEGLQVKLENIKFLARNTGYCGGASVLLNFDKMVRSGEFQPGQTVVLHSVESSKWMTGGFVVRW